MRATLSPMVVLLASLLVACGGGSSDDGSTTGSTTGGGTDGTTDGTTGGTDGGDPNADSGLAHAGRLLPATRVDPTTSGPYSSLGRTRLENLGDSLAVMYEVLDNHGSDAGENCKSLAAEYASCSVVNLHIKDTAGVLNDGNWQLYFHSIRRILRIDSDQLDAYLVNGDLNYLQPVDGFSGFTDGYATVRLVTEFSHLVETDFMPRYWLVRDGAAAQLIANTDESTDESRYAMPISGDNRAAWNGEPNPIADAGNRYARNAPVIEAIDALPPEAIQARIIPQVSSISLGTGQLDISGGFSFAGSALPAASRAALTARQATFMSTAAGTPLSATIDTSLAADTYTLVVNADGIALRGVDEEALFHAAQSLLSLVQPDVGTLPYVSITDSPRFAYRGMHADVARNFHDSATLKRLIDQMSAYKLNRLHLHLSDDEGWRLEIPGLPELTSVGGRRGFQRDADGNVTEAETLMPQLGSGPNSAGAGSGHLTRAAFIELLRYADARYVDIVPAFDMPGHARAAVVAMRARALNLGMPGSLDIRIDDPADSSRYLTVQHYDDGILNPCLPGTYTFVSTVVDAVKAMYEEAGVELTIWHMGGDEARNVFLGAGFQDVGDANKINWKGDVDQSQYDLPWARSPACESFIAATDGVNTRDDLSAYFVRRVADIVANAGISGLYAYQDIYQSLSPADLATMRAGVGFWEMISSGSGYDNALNFAGRGFETVIAVPDFLYFDFPYEVHPEERGYYWAARYTDTAKVFAFAPENLPQNAATSLNRDGNAWSASGSAAAATFAGMQGQLWSETVRTAAQFDYMVFPRLLALAERAWHRADWERDYVSGQSYTNGSALVDQAALAADYAGFAAAVGYKELAKLDAAGVQYRIPVPGGNTASGSLDVNTAFPGLPLEYSTDGSQWSSWDPASPPADAAALRARSANGVRIGRATPLTP